MRHDVPMQTVSHNDDLPSDGSSSGEGLSDGYEGDFETGYGADFDDEYEIPTDETEYDDADETKPGSDPGTDEPEGPLDVDLEGVDVSTLSEGESEEILVEALEDDYGEDADEVLDELESTTGMTAHEILEVLDTDPYDDASGMADTTAVPGSDAIDSDGDIDKFDVDVSPF